MGFLRLNWEKNLIYIVIYWILEIALRLLRQIKKEWFKTTEDKIQNEYMFVIYSNVSDLLSGFLVFYTYRVSRRKNAIKEIEENDIKDDLIYEKAGPSSKYSKTKIILIMIFISFLEYLSRSFYWIAYAITSANSEEVSHFLQKNWTNTLDIIMRYIFSICVLKTVIYKHHKCSLLSMITGFAILFVTDFLLLFETENRYNKTDTFFYSGILLLKGISNPYQHILIKTIYSNCFIFPEKLQFIRGLFEMIIILVITPTLYFSFGLKSDFNFGYEQIICLIVYIFGELFKTYTLLKIIYLYSVQKVSILLISKSLSGCIFGLYKIISNADEKDDIDFILVSIEMLAIIIIILSTLIYDEIIIINKWNLEKDVKVNIIKRGNEENKKENKLDDLPLHPTITVRYKVEEI